MEIAQPFRDYVQRYEDWFAGYPEVYGAELRALRSMLAGTGGSSLEVGVGPGRFAADLGIEIGLDPSPEMLIKAKGRGVRPVLGRAEHLPFAPGEFGLVTMITALCFLADPVLAFSEIRRVLGRDGHIVAAFIDRHSHLGKSYRKHQADSLFYRQARFYGADEVAKLLEAAGFSRIEFCQTIFAPLEQVRAKEAVLPGHGRGGFVVVRGESYSNS
jgi:ubiquinone/menaquinone biosynthesis C-methylase UbiE